MSPPVVTVFIPHHLSENRKYLDLTVKSVLKSQGINFEVLLIADSKEKPEYGDNRLRVIHDKSLDTALKKLDVARKEMHPNSEYILSISDDVIISKTSMIQMYLASRSGIMILNPMCNGDNFHRFKAPLFIQIESGYRALKPDMEYEDIIGYEDQIFNFETGHKDLVVSQPWVSFYCTMVNRRIFDVVGEIDPALVSRHDDQDFCMRAFAQGIPSMIHFGAFCFHFGSKTISKVYSKDVQDKATQHFIAKWKAGE